MAYRGKYHKEALKEALENSASIRQALFKAGIMPEGGNYATVHKLIKELNIDVSHMTGQGWNKGDKLGLAGMNTIPLEKILIKGSTYTHTARLKKSLVEAGLKSSVCENCGLEIWMGKPVPLELNHINGDRFDHRIENLQLLCPNCHAQTPSYRGKNSGSYKSSAGMVER